MTPDIDQAITQLQESFPEAKVDIEPDGDGGAFVTLDPIGLGNQYEQQDTWIGFQITFAYPSADVYPHFVRHDLKRKDGAAVIGAAISLGTFMKKEALQLSRRSNRRSPEHETAAIKLHKVIDWLNSL